MHGHVIICGLGHLGYRSYQLLRRLGKEAAIIYDTAPNEWIREIRAAGQLCLQGDARDNELLEKAGIREARAIIIATDQDLINLAVTMDVRLLNPGIRVVLRLFDQVLAAYLKDLLGIDSVFSTSALAAPAFVRGALGQDVIGHFEFDGRFFVLRETNGTLEQSEDKRIVTAPLEEPGASVAPSIVIAQADSQPPIKGQSAAANRLNSVCRFLKALSCGIRDIPRPIKALVLALLVIIVFSVFLCRYYLNLSLLNSIYLVVATITTIGFGDLNFSQAGAGMKLYACLLMLSGAALMATAVSLVADMLLSARLGGLLSGRALPERSHHIVIGLGRIGLRVVETLRALGEEAVVIESDPDTTFAETLRRGTLIIAGDARGAELLNQAGISQAKSVIAVAEDDVVNIGTALRARELNRAMYTVVRVFDSSLGGKLERQLKFNLALSVSAVSAPAFVAAALYQDVVNAFLWRNRLLLLTRPPAGAAGAYGKELVAFSVRKDDYSLCDAASPADGLFRMSVINFPQVS